jgi:hypothetical protein
LATTSFIYPDNYLPNVRLLAPNVDEIELLFFEAEGLPDQSTILQLAKAAETHEITYNIHMPLELEPGSASAEIRIKTASICHQIFQLTAPICPTTYTLHLPMDPNCGNRLLWLHHLRDTLCRILSSGIESRSISVETLDYPFDWIENLIAEYDLCVCPDIGHLVRDGRDVNTLLTGFSDRISIIHLYGGAEGHAHLPLDHLEPKAFHHVLNFLKTFTGTLCLEVFSFEHLRRSLSFFEKAWSSG